MAHINEKVSKGLLGTKLGMTQVWDENGKLVPVTVIEVAPNVVTQVRTPERDGYKAVQIAYGAIDPRKVNQPLTAHFEAAGVTPAVETALEKATGLGSKIDLTLLQIRLGLGCGGDARRQKPPAPPGEAGTWWVSSSVGANIRSGPGTNLAVVGGASSGSQVTVSPR